MLLPVDRDHPQAAPIDQAVAALRAGELVIIPTDTVYGLACLEARQDAIDRIFMAKNRPVQKKLPRLASRIEQIEAHGARTTPLLQRFAEKYWPGPLTIVLSHPGLGDVAYRIPDHPVALALIERVGSPLVVTSANMSGEADEGTASGAAAALAGSVALVLDAGPCKHMVPSSVISLIDDRFSILRPGAISEADLLTVLH